MVYSPYDLNSLVMAKTIEDYIREVLLVPNPVPERAITWCKDIDGRQYPTCCSTDIRCQTLLHKLIYQLETRYSQEESSKVKSVHNSIDLILRDIAQKHGYLKTRDLLKTLDYSIEHKRKTQDYIRWSKILSWELNINVSAFDLDSVAIHLHGAQKPNHIIDIKSFYPGIKDQHTESTVEFDAVKYIELTEKYLFKIRKSLVVYDYLGRYPSSETAISTLYIDTHSRLYDNWENHMTRTKPPIDYCRLFAFPVSSEHINYKSFKGRIKSFLKRCPLPLFKHIIQYMRKDQRFSDPQDVQNGFFFLQQSPIARHWALGDQTIIHDYFWFDYRQTSSHNLTVIQPESVIVESVQQGTTSEIVKTYKSILAQSKIVDNKLYKITTLAKVLDELLDESVQRDLQVRKRKLSSKYPELKRLENLTTRLKLMWNYCNNN